ncbi:MAG TPA: heavy metal-binding domain-containing protein [Acidimicrobiales bacterium]|nr:heavy metal-binding domain-containing protein [Acidimicrobiales bacterium]
MIDPGHPGGDPTGNGAFDMKAEMLGAARSLGRPATGDASPMTSDLTIDEELILHSIGWEPVELVYGVSIHSVPMGVWTWGQGEITSASDAYAQSFAKASRRIHSQCAKAGGHGVVGVHVEPAVHRHHVDISLVGTAVRPVGSKPLPADSVFVSDLSGRDFTLLRQSGWAPLGLAVGASFVYAPRRSVGTAMKQKGQNVELANFTEAMYAARESAMERMQRSALAMQGTGVVEVKVTEGPMDFAHHAVGFTAYGTVVRLLAGEHRNLGATMILPLDDQVRSFDATSLRGR